MSKFPRADSRCKECGKSVDAPCFYVDSEAESKAGFYHQSCLLGKPDAFFEEPPEHETWACNREKR